jgi:hypothetical protein
LCSQPIFISPEAIVPGYEKTQRLLGFSFIDLVETLANSKVASGMAKVERIVSRVEHNGGSHTGFESENSKLRLGDIVSATLEVLREVEIPVSVQHVHQTLELRNGDVSYSTVKNALNRASKQKGSHVVKFKRGVYCWVGDN